MERRPGASLPVMGAVGAQYDELKQRLLHVWHVMDQSIIDSAVDEWRLRLRACVQTRVDTTSTCNCDIISMHICTTICDMKRFMLC